MFSFLLEDNVWVQKFMFSLSLTDGRLPSGSADASESFTNWDATKNVLGYLHREKEYITHTNGTVDTLPVLKRID